MPKFLSFLNKDRNQTSADQAGTEDDSMGIMPSERTMQEQDTISRATKIKVVSALVLVGFALYAANWIQEPDDYRADVLGSTEESATESEALMAEEAALDAAAETTAETAAEAAAEEEPALLEEEPAAETVEPQDDGLTQEVSIIDFNYNPLETTVPVGGTVIWTNKDAVPHTVSGIDFTSGVMNPGDSFSYLFETDGTYEYACSLHPQMKGKIIVGTGAAIIEEPAVTEPIVDYVPTAEDLGLDENALIETPLEFGAGGEVPLVTSADLALAHAAAADQYVDAGESKSIAQSGPEDLLYLGVFGIILYVRRKKILSLQR